MGLVLLSTALYLYLTAPSNVERFLKEQVSSRTNATLDLQVVRAGFFYGIDMRNVEVRSALDRSLIFQAARINISFFLPSVLIGHLGIREFGIYDPVIHLTAKDGHWNYEALQSKSIAVPEPGTAPPFVFPEYIRTFVPLKLYANLIIRRLSLVYSVTERRRTTTAKIENLNFRLALISKTFHSIPLNSELLDLLETFIIGLNPHEPLRLSFSGSTGMEGDLRLIWLLYRDNKGAETEFLSHISMNTDRLRAVRRGELALPVGFSLGYETIYNMNRDLLVFRYLTLRRKGRHWLEIKARVQDVNRGNARLKLEIVKSDINLAPLSRLISILTRGRIRPFGGRLHLTPLTIEGPLDNLSIRGLVHGSGFYYGSGVNTQRVSGLHMKFSALLDLYRLLPVLERPSTYDSSREKVFGMFNEVRVHNLRGLFNNGLISLTALARPRTGVRARLKFKDFNIDKLAGPHAGGRGDGDINLHSNDTFSHIRFRGTVDLLDAQYSMDRSRSGRNFISLKTRGLIRRRRGGTQIDLNDLALQAVDFEGNPTVRLAGRLSMKFGRDIRFDIGMKDIRIHYGFLHPTLPGDLRYTLSPLKTYFSGETKIAVATRLLISRKGVGIRGEADLTLPFMKNESAALKADVHLGRDEMRFREATFRSVGGDITASVRGKMRRKNQKEPWESDMKIRVRLVRKELTEVFKNIFMEGVVDFRADLDPEEVGGKIALQNLNLEIRGDHCNPPNRPECYRLRFERINLDLPIHHDLHPTHTLRLTAGTGYYNGRTGNDNRKPNLSIDFIAASHKPRNEFAPSSFFYAGGLGAGLERGVTAGLEYRKNVLYIDDLRIHSYHPVTEERGQLRWVARGVIHGRRTFVNFADLEPRNMEYGLFLQLKNLDLEPFLPASRSGYDGIVSADIDILGNSLEDPLNNTTARVSAYRLSPEFSGFVTRLIMPRSIAEWIVNYTLEIPSIRVLLKSGLVYSTIAVRRNFFGYFIQPSDDEIKQERVPLAQFLARARSEVQE